jgi:hypothetical protein
VPNEFERLKFEGQRLPREFPLPKFRGRRLPSEIVRREIDSATRASTRRA